MALPRALLRENVIRRLMASRSVVEPILEVGYGKADLFLQLANAGHRIDGYELSNTARKALLKKITDQQLSNARNLISLPGNGSYRTIIACEVIGYIREPLAWLGQLDNLLATGGWIILSVTNKRHIGSAERLSGNMAGFGKVEIRELAASAGYDLVRCVNYGYPLTNLMRPLLNYLYEKSAANCQQLNEEEEIKRSGNSRNGLLTLLAKTLLNPVTIQPFAWLQRCFSNSSLGTGFVVVMSRTENGFTNV